jgi:ethanolamine kinase
MSKFPSFANRMSHVLLALCCSASLPPRVCIPGTRIYVPVPGAPAMAAIEDRLCGESECTVERMQAGNSNRLWRVRRGVKESFLLREFDELLNLDRRTENAVYKQLAHGGIAPPLIACFDGGRIEGWVDGNAPSASQCRKPEVAEPVGRALAELHLFPPLQLAADTPVDFDQLWGPARAATWLQRALRCADAPELAATRHAPLRARVRRIDLVHFRSRLEAYLRRLRARPEFWSGRLACFCHNDLSDTNLLWRLQPEGARAQMLDFEFAAINLRGFDLAAHCSHWAGGARDGRYDEQAFPPPVARRAFLTSYARAWGGEASTQAEVQAEVQRLQTEVEVAAPLVHAVWGLWALCVLPAATAGEGGAFSHIEYAEQRLAAFESSLDRLDRLRRIEKREESRERVLAALRRGGA